MWATHGLAVALALSVLPGGRTLRPGDCEGAAGLGSARQGCLGGAEHHRTAERPGLEREGAAAGPSGVRPRRSRRRLGNSSRA